MPNHITTEVEISAPKAKIDMLIKDTKIKLDNDLEENEFDFNGIIKMPKELLETVSPTDVVETDEEAFNKNKEYFKDPSPFERTETTKYISKAEEQRRLKKWNAVNWYDFASQNWGTKWNAYEVRFMEHANNLTGDAKLVLSLQTAWDTPRGIWDKLEELGYIVKGVYYGEMDGYEYIGDGADVFEAYQNVEVEYIG